VGSRSPFPKVADRLQCRSLKLGSIRRRTVVARLAHYRVYCGQDSKTLVLLLCGGDKRTQKRDIEVAHGYWQDYQTRTRKRAVSRWKAPAR
jgi:hypothetical protein